MRATTYQAAKAILAGIVTIIGLSFTLVPVASAQQGPRPQAQSGVQIQQVIVRGNQRIESDTVRSYLIIRPGQYINQLDLDRALKTLYGTGLFKNVEVNLVNNTLVVQVIENPIVNRIIYEGNKRTKEEKFTEEVQLAPRSVYTKAKVQADIQRIIQVYRRSGRFAATVTPKIVELPQNRVDVIFEIDEGPKTGIAKINFEGNSSFTDAELRNVVLTSESSWWNLMNSNDNYDPDRLEYDRELLRQHYTQNGYADFQVLSAVAELTPDRKNFFVSFQIEEGPKYKFGKINVKTSLSKISEAYLEQVLPIRTGQTFNSEKIEKATEAITYATGVTGYAFVDVNPRITTNPEARTVDLTFEVNEGPRVYVDQINIKGNTQTLDRVIRREIRLAEGDAFNRVLLDRSERRINSLGFFSDVTIEEVPGSAPDRTNLEVSVAEQSTGSFAIGAGISSTDNFIANLSIEQRNLLGRGQYLQLDLRASSRTRQATIRFREPYFLDRNLSAGFDIYNNEIDYREAGFVQESLGGSLNTGFPVSESGRLGLNYTLRSDSVLVENISTLSISSTADPSDFIVNGADFTEIRDGTSRFIQANFCDFLANRLDPTCESVGDRTTSALGYTLSFNTTNHPYFPSNGWKVNLSQNFAGIGGDVQYLKSEIRAGYYKPLPFDLIGTFELNLGYVDGWGGEKVRISDRFYRGASSFRGFEVAGVGPRYFQPRASGGIDERGRAIGAKAYVVGTAEALLPLPIPQDYGIRVSAFTDIGTAGIVDEQDKILNDNSANYGTVQNGQLICFVDFNRDQICDAPVQDDLSLRGSAGLSINWKSPFGPVQIDLSEPFLKEDYDRTETFRFSAGGQF
ncbi:MAG: outer membrane protein assembly factor BamA [bacterium]